MFSKRVISIVVGGAVGAYTAGQHLDYLSPKKPLAGFLTAASSTASLSTLSINTTTFAVQSPPPPVVPAKDKYQQS
jgi:hypothetical protein